jgi:RNA polymerase sigma factor (sigma-70 family)
MTDADLIEAARRGDRDAFGALVERHQRMVEAVAFSAAGRAHVDDVVQDTFVTAWRTLDRLRDTERVRPWLRTIARNLACKARRRRTHDELQELTGDRTPFDDVADREVAAALGRLPSRYREPLVLFYYEHCTVKEVADALDLREAAVMQRLSRGRKKLGEALACRVEDSLEKKPSRAALVVCVLALIPLGDADAAGAAGAGTGVGAWLAAHWRVPGAVAAATIGAAVLVSANAKSDAIAARAAAVASDHHAEAAPARPQLPPPPERSERRYVNIAPASPDPAETCRRATAGLATAIFGDSAFRVADGELYYEPSPAQQQLSESAQAHAAADCGDGTWPELYVMCEGSMTDLVDGTVNCFPYDPWTS